MFNSTWFYHETLRRVVTVFGTIFNNITVKRLDINNVEIERFKCPIKYGPKEKWYYKINQQTIDTSLVMDASFPMMAFILTDIVYSEQHKLSCVQEIIHHTPEGVRKVYTPNPYKLNFDLYIITKYTHEAQQIVEQILPFFTPGLSVQYKPLEELELRDDLHFVLDSVGYSDDWEDNWEKKRHIEWKLSYSVIVNFYSPIQEQGYIKEVVIDFRPNLPLNKYGEPITTNVELNKIPRSSRLTVVPDPTTAIATDDYGYTETLEFFTDGKRYDPITDTDVDI
jgi:hypothetical protein